MVLQVQLMTQHRKEDFAFILTGITAVFEEQTAVSSSYLPGSKRPVPYILEICASFSSA